ncbi:MAG TPA: hypothetical protein VIK72_02550 [Clostridiaceae bacterium]
MRKLIVIFIILTVMLTSATGCITGKQASYADVFTLEDIMYCATSEEVITDDKIIESQVGTIKFTLSESNKSPTANLKNGEAAYLKVGTKIYSLKDLDQKIAVAAQNQGKWILYKAVSENNSDAKSTGNGITEDTFKATALIVGKQGTAELIKIEDKEKIKKVIDSIKLGEATTESLNYPEGNMYTFYFEVPDTKGIGQIAYKYYLNFQDVNLEGYVRRFDSTYKVDSSVNKIITEPFGNPETIYDSKLGGKQQIYDILGDGKLILRKVVKETPSEKFTVKVLEQGEEIWQNGSKLKDTLPGKYKVEIFMKDTKLQEKILNVLAKNQLKLQGVSSVSSSTADGGESYVLYLSYDKKPELGLMESADSFVLVATN